RCRGGALLKKRFGERDRRTRAGGGGGAKQGCPGDRLGALTGKRGFDFRARDPRLNDRRDGKAEHQSPPDLVRHQERVREALADLGNDVAHAVPALSSLPICYTLTGYGKARAWLRA